MYQLDAINGKISDPINSVGTGITGSSYPKRAVVHPSGKFLYVILDPGHNGGITFYSIDGATGALGASNVVSDSMGLSPLSITFNPTGNLAGVRGAAQRVPELDGLPHELRVRQRGLRAAHQQHLRHERLVRVGPGVR